MLFQPTGFEFRIWAMMLALLVLGGPTLLPVITALIYARRTSWLSSRSGFLIGLGVALLGSGTYAAAFFAIFALTETAVHPAVAFGILIVVIACQIALAVRLCRFVNHRRHRSWGIRRW
ncbi:MAG: hypothetical protein OXM01_08910 [Gemmatimonadota bacterium]|nr:hypothetical protein [Gemmatimonadota bacterium]